MPPEKSYSWEGGACAGRRALLAAFRPLVSAHRHGPPSTPPHRAVHRDPLLQAGHAVWRAEAGVPLADRSRQRFRCRESVTPGDQADLPSREHLHVFLAGSTF